jgi:hypothetical protein
VRLTVAPPPSGCPSASLLLRRLQAIRLDGKDRHLGTYRSEKEAALAYDRAAHHHFGVVAYLNFPDEILAPTADKGP